MAGAAALVTLTLLQARRGATDAWAAAAAGLAFGLAPLVWSQAIIAEVYALNALLLALLVWSLRSDRPLFWRALFMGLAITTHLTSLLLLPWVGASLWRGLRARPAARSATLGLTALGGALGLLPLAALPLLAAGGSPVVWGDPTTLRGWWWLVGGQLYRPNVLGLPAAEWAPRLHAWGPQLLAQFTLLGLPLLLYGAFAAPRAARRDVAWLLASAAGYLVYAFGYRSGDALVFALPALLLLSHVLAFALRRLRAGALLLPLLLLALNFGRLDLRTDRGVADAAHDLLAAAPADAVLVTPGDNTLFTLWYFQQAVGLRSDLILVDANLFAFDWYRSRLQWLYPQLAALDRDDLARFIARNAVDRPTCTAALQEAIPLRCDLARRPGRT